MIKKINELKMFGPCIIKYWQFSNFACNVLFLNIFMFEMVVIFLTMFQKKNIFILAI